jgi:hypothetical protein
MITPAKKRKCARELLESALVQSYIQKFFKVEKQLLTSRKIRDWASYPSLKKLALLYFANQLESAGLESYKNSFFQINKNQSG